VQSVIHLVFFIRSSIHSSKFSHFLVRFFHSFIRSFIHLFHAINSFFLFVLRSSIHSFIHPFIHSFIYSPILRFIFESTLKRLSAKRLYWCSADFLRQQNGHRQCFIITQNESLSLVVELSRGKRVFKYRINSFRLLLQINAASWTKNVNRLNKSHSPNGRRMYSAAFI